MQNSQQELSSEIESSVKEKGEKMKQSQDFTSADRNSISAEMVERTWQRVAALSLKDAPKIIQRMTKEQPVTLAYLMAVDSDIFNNEERQTLLYLGIVVWQIMLQGTRPLTKITEKMLDEAEAKNLKIAEYLQGETETGFEETTRKIIETYKQPEVLRYIVEAIMEDTEETSSIREESKGIMFLDLKTVIDCFDA